jgi:hypothetical protein
MALQVGENAIAAFLMQPVQLAFKKSFEIHSTLQCRAIVFVIA